MEAAGYSNVGGGTRRYDAVYLGRGTARPQGTRLDTANVILGDTRPPMTYHITFHKFDDECMDAGATSVTPGDTTGSCTRWRLGKQKFRTLDNNRVSFELGEWIERVTFMWYVREPSGELVRRRTELRDTGPTGR